MKKIFALILTLLIVSALAACAQNSDAQPTEVVLTDPEPGLVGAYDTADSPVITDEIKTMFNKATEELTGVDYVPVAYVASQIVAGTNHVILCTATPVVPDAVTTYALVTVYEDLDGNTQITDIQESGAIAPEAYDEDNPVDGAVTPLSSPEMTAEATAAVEKACETLTGAVYTPVALLGTQIVAGTNYTVLCKATPSIPSNEAYYVIITVYEDLDGNAEIMHTEEFASTTAAISDAEDAPAEQDE